MKSTILKHATLLVVLIALVSPALWSQGRDMVYLQGSIPPPPTGVSGAPAGTGGAGIYYYYVLAHYGGGFVTHFGPVTVSRAAVPLAPGAAVTLRWNTVNGVGVTYDVLRTPTSSLPATGACVCAAATGLAVTTFTDVGGALGPYTITSFPFQLASASIYLNVRDYPNPHLEITTPTAGGVRFNTNVEALANILLTSGGRISWSPSATNPDTTPAASLYYGQSTGVIRSDSELRVANLLNAPIDWSYKTGSVQGVGSRLISDYTTVTSLKGADFRATSSGGAGNFLLGVQAISTTGPGSGSVVELYGGNFVATHNTGAVGAAYGVVGLLQTGAGATQTGWFTNGVMGVIDDAAGLKTAINYPSAVMGAIFDQNTATDAAVTAYLALDAVRAAAQSPRAAFWVVGRTIKPGVNFNYGLDMFYHCAIGVCSGSTEDTRFNVADVRGNHADMLDNNTVGVWHVTRGVGNLTGIQLQLTSFANLNAWAAANGTMAYCSDCDAAVAGAGPTVCASAGAKTGTFAFRLNNAWTCLGI